MAIAAPALTSHADRNPVAPWWHTIVFIIALLAYGLPELYRHPVLLSERFQNHRFVVYSIQILLELSVLAYVWWGVRLAGGNLRDLVGGKWSSTKDVLRDIGTAFVLWLAVIGMLLAMHVILKDNPSSVRAFKPLLPQNYVEMIGWVVVSVTAGFCEEIIFRGYLQRQFLALTGSAYVAVLIQAVLFGSVHLYQGPRGAITIAIYGVLFGFVAVRVKSLRPGMLQHAAQDSFAGIAGSLLVKYNRL